MFKSIVLSLFLLFGVANAAPPIKDTTPEVPAQIPQQGAFQDGAMLFWLCEPGMKGRFKIMFMTPEGKQYPAEVSCVSETAKNS